MSKRSIDVDAARKLVDEIPKSQPAAGRHQPRRAARGGERAEGYARTGGAEPPELEVKMKSVPGMFERASTELQADGVRAGMFLSAIGRMIGLD